MFNTNFSASQYGASYFTHDKYTNITDNATNSITNQSYSDLVEEVCNDLLDDSESCEAYKGIGYVVSTNFTALHASILFQAVADESIVRTALQSNDIDIKVTLHPFILQNLKVDLNKLPMPFLHGMCRVDVIKTIFIAVNCYLTWLLLKSLLYLHLVQQVLDYTQFPIITGSFANFIVQERISKAKHLQTVAGVKPTAHWLATYLWDMLNYQFPIWTVIALMYAFDVQAFITRVFGDTGGTIVPMLLFGPAAAGFTYM